MHVRFPDVARPRLVVNSDSPPQQAIYADLDDSASTHCATVDLWEGDSVNDEHGRLREYLANRGIGTANAVPTCTRLSASLSTRLALPKDPEERRRTYARASSASRAVPSGPEPIVAGRTGQPATLAARWRTWQ